VKLLTNAIFVRMAAAFLIAIAAFVAGVVGLRILRRRIIEDDVLADNAGEGNTSYPYSVVIQQLKQQKFELQTEQQTQRRRTKTSEQITSAVIAKLPCGVLFVAPNGLIKQANAAARRILGFASPLGMGLDELFRDSSFVLKSGESGRIADLFKKALQGPAPSPFEGRYCTANGEERALAITLIPLNTGAGESLGIASVITDESSNADSRRAQLLHGEISAEMALELRTSLEAIRVCAGQMSAANDPRSIANFVSDISSKAERLEKLVGGFLAESVQTKASAARA
jgi:PAS domain-containing protein